MLPNLPWKGCQGTETIHTSCTGGINEIPELYHYLSERSERRMERHHNKDIDKHITAYVQDLRDTDQAFDHHSSITKLTRHPQILPIEFMKI